jgi:glycosyltransferase involved in cell wall biosynthesis
MLCPKIHSGYDENIVEAMYFSCPVISSNSGAPLEIIGNHEQSGFLLTNNKNQWIQKSLDIIFS